MSAFNGEKFYGYSPVRESSLSTVPRNFEFKFVRPEQLDKVIKQSQADKTFGSTPSTRSSRGKQAIRPRDIDYDEYQLRDRDVETIMSRSRMHKVRVLSDQEVNEIVLQAKMSAALEPKVKTETISKFSQSLSTKFFDGVPTEEPCQEVFSEHRSEINLQTDELEEAQTTDEKAFFTLTKSVESSLQAVESLLQLREKKSKELTLYESHSLEILTPKPCYAEIQEQQNADRCIISEIKKPILYKNPLGEKVASQLGSVSSYESVLSNEPVEAYAKNLYTEPEIPFKEEEKQLQSSTSDMLQSHQPPRFIQMDIKVPKMSLGFLKNSAPMHFTELTEDGDTEQNMKVFIKNRFQVQQEVSEPPAEKPITIAPKSKVPLKSQKQWQPSYANTPRPKSERISARSHGSVAYSARPPIQKSNISNTARTQPPSTASSARLSTNKPLSRYLSGRNNAGKTIEALKAEKVDIFQRMSNTQERIIELLDKLKMSLLEVYIPTSTHEKNKRQKNAMEFSVRFSRNFLYPLKGMIEDVRVTSPDVFNSATSNDATMRVFNIYNLLQQSLSTYYKQLRFFLLDQVPQKLSSVLEMINAVTKACLHKGIFDQNDTIVECMLDRSNKFLDFLSELHDKTDKHESNVVRVTNPSRMGSKNYDLKMCMNDLNMYEPKLVPKRKYRKTPSKKAIENKPIESIVVTHTQILSARKSNELCGLNMENISTQMMHNEKSEVNPSASIQESSAVQKDEPSYNKTQIMARKLSEALRNATKNQVSHVLEPVLRNFGIGSDQQNTENFQTAETIINAFTEQILKIVENSNPTPISKSRKERKVATGNTRKGSSKNATVKATSKALKATNRTKLRRHKTNKTAAIATKSTTISEQATCVDDDNNQIHNDDTSRQQHMFDNNNNEAFTLIFSECQEDDDSEVETSESETHNDSSQNYAPSDVGDSYHAYNPSDCEIGNVSSRHSGGDGPNDSDANTPVPQEQRQQEVQFHRKAIAMEESSQSDYEQQAEEEHMYSAENTTNSDEEVDREMEQYYTVLTGNNLPINIDGLNPSNVTLESSHVTEKQKNISNQKSKKPGEKIHTRKPRIYGKKKRRDPLATPPPVPVVTPSNSARSEERLEIMVRELQKVYNSPNKKACSNTLKNNRNDEVLSPTPMSMSPPVNNPKVATSHQMTSDAKLMTNLKNIQVPLTEAFCENVALNNTMDNISKKTKIKRSGVDKSPQSALEVLQNLTQETTPNYQYQRNQATNYQVNMKNSNHVLNVNESPYDMKAWANALKDLPKVHEDTMLKRIMEKERALYNAFKENDTEIPKAPSNSPRIKKIKEKNEYPEHIANLFKERNKFLEDCQTNRFYTNPAYEQPWKIFSNIADLITQEIVGSVENDFSEGVTKFVQDFLHLETQL